MKKKNKYRFELTRQPRNNNLDYMVDPTFRNINRFFVFSFKNGDKSATNPSNKYYMPLVNIKDFNALIDNKQLFDQPVKNKQEAYELIKMSINDDYITGNLLDYSYRQNNYKLICIDLSRQTKSNYSTTN